MKDFGITLIIFAVFILFVCIIVVIEKTLGTLVATLSASILLTLMGIILIKIDKNEK